MSREIINGALSLASQIREKKNQIIKDNYQVFEDIKNLDNMLREEMNKIYNSEDLEPYDILTINQSLGFTGIESKPIKLSISDKDSSSTCNLYFEGSVSVFFIDSNDLSTATKIGYREFIDKSLLSSSFWISDGSIVRYWIYDEGSKSGYFDNKFLESCK